jgi:hypothetical protein
LRDIITRKSRDFDDIATSFEEIALHLRLVIGELEELLKAIERRH